MAAFQHHVADNSLTITGGFDACYARAAIGHPSRGRPWLLLTRGRQCPCWLTPCVFFGRCNTRHRSFLIVSQQRSPLSR